MKARIMLPDGDGKPMSTHVSAVKIGQYFAIHRDIRWARDGQGKKRIGHVCINKSGWTITHLPTGYAILNALKFRRQAVKAAQRLAAVKAINWKRKQAEGFREEAHKLPDEVKTFISKLERTLA